MSNLSYDIIKWDSIIPEGSIEPQPYIVIKPDTALLDLATINENKIHVTVKDTKSKYDNTASYVAVFINKDTLLLKSKWYGEPTKNGKVIIEIYKPIEPDNSIVFISNNFNYLYKVFLMVIVVFLIFYMLIKLNK